MSKARITVTFEYDIEPEYYPDGATPSDMVVLDVENYRSDYTCLLDVMQSNEVTVTGEVVED